MTVRVGCMAMSAARAAVGEAMFLYGRTSSSNTQKVMWVLEHLSLPYTLVSFEVAQVSSHNKIIDKSCTLEQLNYVRLSLL